MLTFWSILSVICAVWKWISPAVFGYKVTQNNLNSFAWTFWISRWSSFILKNFQRYWAKDQYLGFSITSVKAVHLSTSVDRKLRERLAKYHIWQRKRPINFFLLILKIYHMDFSSSLLILLIYGQTQKIYLCQMNLNKLMRKTDLW